jgi:hypothetical protein
MVDVTVLSLLTLVIDVTIHSLMVNRPDLFHLHVSYDLFQLADLLLQLLLLLLLLSLLSLLLVFLLGVVLRCGTCQVQFCCWESSDVVVL